MKTKTAIKVVILIFLDGEKIFIEKRVVKGFDKEQYLIPGGIVEETELNNLEAAIKREAIEELGVTPEEFINLHLQQKIFGLGGVILKPFIITRWSGNLPPTILDEGNPTVWLTIEEILNCTYEPTRKIAQALKKHLSRKK